MGAGWQSLSDWKWCPWPSVKSDYSSNDRWVAISERKKVQKLSQVNQERPFEFTMNTSTWFKKYFNQDFIFFKCMLPSEYELFISMSPLRARHSYGLKRCPDLPAGFSRLPLIYFNDTGSLWLMKLSAFQPQVGQIHETFKLLFLHLLFFFFLLNIWIYYYFKQRNQFQLQQNMLSIPVMTGKLTPQENKKQSEN